MPLKPTRAILASILVVSLTSGANAQTASELAGLSKSDFLERVTTFFRDSIAIQRELLDRVQEGMGELAISDEPTTDAERASFECTYDYLAERDQLLLYAQQLLSMNVIRDMADADPEFDFVTMVFDEAALDAISAAVPGEALAAMTECGQMAATGERMDFNAEVWAVIGQEAQARGYQ